MDWKSRTLSSQCHQTYARPWGRGSGLYRSALPGIWVGAGGVVVVGLGVYVGLGVRVGLVVDVGRGVCVGIAVYVGIGDAAVIVGVPTGAAD